MKIAQVPATLKIELNGYLTTINWPEGTVFFFPEGKKEFNIFELREIVKEMEKMNG